MIQFYSKWLVIRHENIPLCTLVSIFRTHRKAHDLMHGISREYCVGDSFQTLYIEFFGPKNYIRKFSEMTCKSPKISRDQIFGPKFLRGNFFSLSNFQCLIYLDRKIKHCKFLKNTCKNSAQKFERR